MEPPADWNSANSPAAMRYRRPPGSLLDRLEAELLGIEAPCPLEIPGGESCRRLAAAQRLATREGTGGARPEHRLQVEHRRAVKRLEVANLNSEAVDGEHLDLVQADRVRAIGRARAEHPAQRIGRVIARVDPQDVPPSAVEPGQDDEPVPDRDVLQRVGHRVIEGEPGSGAPSKPCFGADAGSVRGDSTLPIGVSSSSPGTAITPRRPAGRRGS